MLPPSVQFRKSGKILIAFRPVTRTFLICVSTIRICTLKLVYIIFTGQWDYFLGARGLIALNLAKEDLLKGSKFELFEIL